MVLNFDWYGGFAWVSWCFRLGWFGFLCCALFDWFGILIVLIDVCFEFVCGRCCVADFVVLCVWVRFGLLCFWFVGFNTGLRFVGLALGLFGVFGSLNFGVEFC